MLLFCLLSILISITYSQPENCLFTDVNTGTIQLDLRPLSRMTIGPYFDGEQYNYTYSICSNSLLCNTQRELPPYVMIDTHIYDQTNGECWWLAKFNDTIQPEYISTTETWLFPPMPGQGCVGLNGTNRTTH